MERATRSAKCRRCWWPCIAGCCWPACNATAPNAPKTTNPCPNGGAEPSGHRVWTWSPCCENNWPSSQKHLPQETPTDLPNHGRSRRRVRKYDPPLPDPLVQNVQTPGPSRTSPVPLHMHTVDNNVIYGVHMERHRRGTGGVSVAQACWLLRDYGTGRGFSPDDVGHRGRVNRRVGSAGQQGAQALPGPHRR